MHPADPLPFVHHSVPNRSLGPRARRGCLAGIAAMTAGVALGATAFGAWPVLPFAGLEVGLVWLAFHSVQRHDGDFERLEVDAGQVRWASRDARREQSLTAYAPWARVVMEERGPSCRLHLQYKGRMVPLGRLLSDEGRRRLAADLRSRLSVTAIQ